MKNRILIILLIVYSILATSSMLNKAVTYDEIVYVSAGYNLWKTGYYGLNIEHPPLSKLIAGFPLLALNPELPHNTTPVNDDEWQFSREFFFEKGNDYQMLFWSRIPFIIIGIITGVYVYFFAKYLYGEKAGLLALFFYVLSPNIIAYSQLAITDFIIAAFTFMSFYHFIKYLDKPKKHDLYISGFTLGLALSSKFSALYLLPAYFILFLMKSKKKIWKSNFKDTAIMVLIAIITLALTYSFEINYFIDGFLYVLKQGTYGRFSYLLGSHYIGNNLLYYPVAFFVKTQIPFIIMLGLSAIRKPTKKDLFMIPVLIFLIPSFVNKTNLGIRHILVIYPFLFVYASNVINVKCKQWFKYILWLLLIWYSISALLSYPHYLAYFNEIAGDEGHRFLLDSNLDWGQDGLLLDAYLEGKNASVSYFGNHVLNSTYQNLECWPTKGIIAISANNLFGLKESSAACNLWLLQFQPIKKIGKTIWIYNITKDFSDYELQFHLNQYQQALERDMERIQTALESECMSICRDSCSQHNKKYLSSRVEEGRCFCQCSDI